MSTTDRITTRRLIDQQSHVVGHRTLSCRDDLRDIPRAISGNLKRLREDLISRHDAAATPMTDEEVDQLIVLTIAAADRLYGLVTDSVGESDSDMVPVPHVRAV